MVLVFADPKFPKMAYYLTNFAPNLMKLKKKSAGGVRVLLCQYVGFAQIQY